MEDRAHVKTERQDAVGLSMECDDVSETRENAVFHEDDNIKKEDQACVTLATDQTETSQVGMEPPDNGVRAELKLWTETTGSLTSGGTETEMHGRVKIDPCDQAIIEPQSLTGTCDQNVIGPQIKLELCDEETPQPCDQVKIELQNVIGTCDQNVIEPRVKLELCDEETPQPCDQVKIVLQNVIGTCDQNVIEPRIKIEPCDEETPQPCDQTTSEPHFKIEVNTDNVTDMYPFDSGAGTLGTMETEQSRSSWDSVVIKLEEQGTR
jgi:hypothetical protein